MHLAQNKREQKFKDKQVEDKMEMKRVIYFILY